MKQEPGRRQPGIPSLKGGEDAKAHHQQTGEPPMAYTIERFGVTYEVEPYEESVQCP